MDLRLLEECIEVAGQAARQAGAVLEQFRRRVAVREKGRFDLVTDADLAAQETIERLIHARFPDHDFLGEESARQAGTPAPPVIGWSGRPCPLQNSSENPPQRPTWIVDPLDGTTNYVHDCPVYGVSIGLEYEGALVVGVVFDPSRQELFHAGRGLGAWLNGRRLQTTAVARLEEALLSCGFPPDLRGQEHTLDVWSAFSLRTQSLRRTGSTSLNLAYVAAARHDGFWTYQAHPWDAAAGVVLIQEAGGRVSNLDGSPYNLHTLDLLASNGPLHPAMLDVLRLLGPP